MSNTTYSITFRRVVSCGEISWNALRGQADVGEIVRVDTHGDGSSIVFRACCFLDGDDEIFGDFDDLLAAKAWITGNAQDGEVFRAWPVA